jgi:hypothetical protein
MRPSILRAAITVSILTLLGSAWAVAGHGAGCSHCGCQCACQKVCRLVKEDKKVEVVCWGVKCEDFCVAGPSCKGCQHCEEACDLCAEGSKPANISTHSKKFVWTEWIPGCATVHTKKKLMKRTVTKTIPSYKWVVEDLCSACDAKAQGAAIEPGAAVPPPPVANARLKYGPVQSPPPVVQVAGQR